MRRGEVLTHATPQMQPENMPSEKAHHESHVLYVSTYEMSRTGKCPEAEGRFMAARGWGRKEWGVTVNGYEVSFGDDE